MLKFPRTRGLDGRRKAPRAAWSDPPDPILPRMPLHDYSAEELRHGGVVATLPKEHPNYPGCGGGVICDAEHPKRMVFIEESNHERITCPKCSVLAAVVLANKMWPNKGETHDEFRTRLANLINAPT